MAKLPRKTQKVFAAGASNNGVFGSAQAGTKVLSNDLATIQGLSAFNTGWLNAVISGERLPTLEEMQALHYLTTSQLAYLFQEGIPEYDSGTTYFTNSIVKKTGTYEMYGSLVDNNTGNALGSQADTANWKYLGTLGGMTAATNTQSNTGSSSTVALTPANFGSQQSKSGSGYQYLPGGIILQWAVTSSLTAAADTTVTFPIAFPTGCLNVFAGVGSILSGGQEGGVAVKSFTTTQTVLRNTNTTGAKSCNYFAIGY